MPNALYARSNPRVAAMDRVILKANLKGFAAFLINLLVKLLPIILPLLVAARQADADGVASLPPGSSIPPGTDPVVARAIEAARASD